MKNGPIAAEGEAGIFSYRGEYLSHYCHSVLPCVNEEELIVSYVFANFSMQDSSKLSPEFACKV